MLVLSVAVIPAPAPAQSALERPPNLSGGWTGEPGPLHFHVTHRFNRVGELNKVIASPTFLLAGGVPFGGMIGLQYATSSTVAPTPTPNEWEAFVRWRAVGGADSPLRASVQAGHNFAVSSMDGEVTLAAELGRLTVVGTGRAFSRPYGERSTRFAAGGGVVLRLSRHIGIAADMVSLLDLEDGEREVWSAGLLLGIPFTPHTLSLHATNANTATLQGGSRGRSETRWGFEFTVPITPARLIGRTPSAAAERPVAAADTVPAAADTVPAAADTVPPAGVDTVHADIVDFSFPDGRIEVDPGTTIVWTNRGEQEHNVSAVDGAWSSPLLRRGESWARTFQEPGSHAFFCEPHPFMQGVVVVTQADAGATSHIGPALRGAPRGMPTPAASAAAAVAASPADPSR